MVVALDSALALSFPSRADRVLYIFVLLEREMVSFFIDVCQRVISFVKRTRLALFITELESKFTVKVLQATKFPPSHSFYPMNS